MIREVLPNTARYLVTGATGMVGRALMGALRAAGQAVAGTSRTGADSRIADELHFRWDVADPLPPPVLDGWHAQYLIHAAALTDVNRCESQPDEARRVNVRGTAHVTALATRWGSRLVYLSTDSVFDGRRGGYADDEPPSPVNVYAETKALGEVEALRRSGTLVARFNVIGPGRLTSWILGSVVAGTPIEVFEDVRFNPVETRDLAALLGALAVAPIAGVCHLGSDEVISKADYAERLIAYAGLKSGGRVRRVRLADRPMQASRPLDTSLRVSASVAALCPVPSLDAAIRRLAAEFITTPPVSGRRAAVNERNDP